MKTILVALAFALSSAASADLLGRVTAVHDGDTITVFSGQQPTRVRLANIDAPERHQAFGAVAKQTLSGLVFGRQVNVSISGTDRYGRVIGTVYAGTENINRMMVGEGMAWAYVQYLDDPVMLSLESSARVSGRGLWSATNPAPIPPWQFRRQQR